MADDWRLAAACRGAENPDMWHPGDFRGALTVLLSETARRICLRCPVIDNCYSYYAALPTNQRRDVVAGGAIWSNRGVPDRERLALAVSRG